MRYHHHKNDVHEHRYCIIRRCISLARDLKMQLMLVRYERVDLGFCNLHMIMFVNKQLQSSATFAQQVLDLK